MRCEKKTEFTCTECGNPLVGYFKSTDEGNLIVMIDPCPNCVVEGEE